jgi:hypothetical protein
MMGMEEGKGCMGINIERKKEKAVATLTLPYKAGHGSNNHRKESKLEEQYSNISPKMSKQTKGNRN